MAKKTIGIDQLDNFSVDEETNELFWRNAQVVTVVSLPWWVQASVLIASIATAVSAIAAVAALFK